MAYWPVMGGPTKTDLASRRNESLRDFRGPRSRAYVRSHCTRACLTEVQVLSAR